LEATGLNKLILLLKGFISFSRCIGFQVYLFLLTGLTDQPVYLSASSKAPTYSEVFESLSEFGIFQIREKEELRRAVFCSEKSDVTGNRTKGVRGKILIILFYFLIRKIRLLQI
jgi:hypothetical protein